MRPLGLVGLALIGAALGAVVHAADDTQWRRCYDHFAGSDYATSGAFDIPLADGTYKKYGLDVTIVPGGSLKLNGQVAMPRDEMRAMVLDSSTWREISPTEAVSSSVAAATAAIECEPL